MQSLNPEHALDELERAYRSFMDAPTERRAELTAVLQRILAKKLLGLAELAKGSLAQG
jgi:hypothetical protein